MADTKPPCPKVVDCLKKGARNLTHGETRKKQAPRKPDDR